MKILLVGEYYSENLGDPLLCRTVEQVIREHFPQAQIIPFDMSGKTGADAWYQPETDPKMDWITERVCDRFRDYRRAAICRAYEGDRQRYLRVWYRLKALRREHRFDLVIFSGGSLFMDYFAGIVNLIIRQFAFSKTRILFHACGMSNLDADGIYLLRQALCSGKVASISLRDSFGRFEELFSVKAPLTQTYDTALCCASRFSPAGKRENVLGVGLIDRCFDRQRHLLAQLLRSGIRWQAFTNGSPYDQDCARKLLLEAGIPREKLEDYLLPRPESPEQLVGFVTGFSGIIAFRMHCQIVAASFGIPSYGLVWDDKITAFYEKLGFPENCTEQMPQLNRILQVLSQTDSARLRERAQSQGVESCQCLIRAIEAAVK